MKLDSIEKGVHHAVHPFFRKTNKAVVANADFGHIKHRTIMWVTIFMLTIGIAVRSHSPTGAGEWLRVVFFAEITYIHLQNVGSSAEL